jgi:hypothetical protein
VESFCESFVSARQTQDWDDVDPSDSLGGAHHTQKHVEDECMTTTSFASAKSRFPKPRLAQTARVLDEGPDDEIHHVFKKHVPRSHQPTDKSSTLETMPTTTDVIAKDETSKSWFSPLTDIFTSKTESPSWFGNQTMKAMLLLLYVSASVAVTSTTEPNKKFKKERQNQQQEQQTDQTATHGPSEQVAASS